MPSKHTRTAVFARDVEHAVRIVKRQAQQAAARRARICSDDVWRAIEAGAMLPCSTERRYRSAFMGRAFVEAHRRGFTKRAGTMRNRYGTLVCAWRAA